MNPIRIIFLLFFILLLYSCKKEDITDVNPSPVYSDYISRETIDSLNYKLIFTNNSPNFNSDFGKKVQKLMIEAFFKVYPKLAEKYNPMTATTVYFTVDPYYNGVAETVGTKVKFSSKWMLNQPTDIDVVTHEIMHIIQAYPGNNPSWLVEGIADYVRYRYGIDNTNSGWFLPNYSSGQNYTDSYRITARFLVWLENHVKKDVVKQLNIACRENTYSSNTWKLITGNTIDELWLLYASNPAL